MKQKPIYLDDRELELCINLLADEKDNFALTYDEREMARDLWVRFRSVYLYR